MYFGWYGVEMQQNRFQINSWGNKLGFWPMFIRTEREYLLCQPSRSVDLSTKTIRLVQFAACSSKGIQQILIDMVDG